MATIIKNELKNGTSYRIQVKVKDENTGKLFVKAMTWKKPQDVKDTEAKRLVQKVAFEFEDKVYKQNAGIQVKENNMCFIDYARDRLERQKPTISIHTYVKETRIINEFENFFCKIKMQDLSPSIIQDFLDMKQINGKQDTKAICKKKFKALLHENKISAQKLQTMAKVSKPLYVKSQLGNKIEVENAKAMCNALNVKYSDYFTTIKKQTPYAKSTVNSYRKTLCAILATAKRQRLVEHNYASRDYIKAIKGTKKEIEILDENQAKIFANAIEKVDNIERKIALMTFLYMGVRRSELAGLQWKDINFETGTMHIQRSLHFEPHFGKYYKCTKTESSNREITMPEQLIKEYKYIGNGGTNLNLTQQSQNKKMP
jgi:site-specific recombinase XerC